MKRLLLALCAFVLFACPSESDDETTLTLTITSDMRVPQELDSVTVSITGQDTDRDPVADRRKQALPRTLTLVHESGPLGPVPIIVRGFLGDELVIRIDTSASFPESGDSELTIHLDRTCRNVMCPSSQTCDEGKCMPVNPVEDAGVRDASTRDARVEDAFVPDARTPEDASLDASADAGPDSSTVDAGADAGPGSLPSCTITLPVTGDTYQNGVLFPLQGTCSDPESGALSDLTWLSSRDGLLGNGADLEGRLTSAGMHRVSLCAPDPRDATRVGCASVDLEGSPLPQPNAAITSLAQGSDVASPYVSNLPLVYTGAGTGAGVVASWSDDVQGALGNGNSATLATPFVGRHTVTFTVRDRNGVQRSTTAQYLVLGPGETGLVSPLVSVNAELDRAGDLPIPTIASDAQSRAYVPSSSGVWYRFDGNSLGANATVAVGQPPLNDVVQDAQISNNITYLATRQGLTVCAYAASGAGEPCTNYRAGGVLQSQNFLSVLRMVDNRNVDTLMIGSDNGLFLSDSVNGSVRGSTILRGRNVNDMVALNGQAALAMDNGLTLLVPSTQAQVRFTTMEGLPSNQLRALATSADNTLWIAANGGLAHFEPGSNRITSWNNNRGLPSSNVNGVAVHRPPQLGRDIIWAATSAGVARLEPSNNTITVFTTADGLPSNNVLSVHVLANGTKLFGTQNGLAHYIGL